MNRDTVEYSVHDFIFLSGLLLCIGGWWRWALLSPDRVAPSRMVDVSASVNLPLHHKVQWFSSGTGSPGWSWKKGRKTVVVVITVHYLTVYFIYHSTHNSWAFFFCEQ